jgi:uncharacterized protein
VPRTPDTTPTTPTAPEVRDPAWAYVLYLLLGLGFGWVLVRAEIVSWFRVQEMFRFQAFHMFGIILSAIVTARVALFALERSGVRAANGEPITVPPKAMGTGARYAGGGVLFGVGWAFTGACPGPLFALASTGATVMLLALAAALAGTFVYGLLRPRLPH